MAGDGGTANKPKTILALDNGAFAAAKRGEGIPVEPYTEFVLEHHHLLDVVFSCDVIGDGEKSLKNFLYMRDKGLNPVPVYHDGTPLKYLEFYLRDLDIDYVAIGGIAGQHVPRLSKSLKSLWDDYLLDSIGYPKLKCHAFGITSPRVVASFPWISVDSSTWARESRKYGNCLIPKRKKYESGCYSYRDPPTAISVTTSSSHRDNHIDRLPTYRRHQVVQYFEQRGFRLEGLRKKGRLRDQLNAIYYVEMGRELKKIVYLAGNFSALGNPEVERAIQQQVFALGSNYYRLISFDDNPKIQTVLDLKRGETSYD